ncbi:anhydro-N-acetylmuramic acid kinase-like [Folsomia candida]|uniref:anhydro-N-acetylmuramic acid kinase-like n=1 Tax=Folsomia candida TaxID=158441 RepID=UPI00160519CD|nr:anhydro-N-acetylmuramic acid kinase-like [Folsomia candida]
MNLTNSEILFQISKKSERQIIGLMSGIVLNCLQQWNIPTTDVDLIASHGQTVYHAPKSFHGMCGEPNSTLQVGDGDHISVKTGILTVSDFRQKHVAAGGEGAPLALYGDYFIFSKQGENRIMLNIGGISNISCLYGDLDPTKAFATDLGPGNTMIDTFTREHFNQDCDYDGKIAKQGQVNMLLLTALKSHPFFSAPFPKTTGPELFNLSYIQNAQISSATTNISNNNIVATLTRFTAEVIADGINKVCVEDHSFKIFASGGGVHNPVLYDHIQNLLSQTQIKLTEELGIPGDAKEAILFATLANELVAGGRTNFGDRLGIPSVSMGKISFPG